MNRIVWLSVFVFSSCSAQKVAGIYTDAPPTSNNREFPFRTTLILKQDFSYSFEIHNDVALLAINEGSWKLHKGTIYFKSRSYSDRTPDEDIVSVKMLTIDSLVDSEKRALEFYMVAHDTSWIIGATISSKSFTLTTGLDGHPLVVDRLVDSFNFEFLGKKLTISIPEGRSEYCFQYYINFSRSMSSPALQSLPFENLNFENGTLTRDGQALFERRSKQY